jgi:hypothetical protein
MCVAAQVYAPICADAGPIHMNPIQNPAQMLQRLKALRDDLPKVQEDWRRVIAAKHQLIEVMHAVKRLELWVWVFYRNVVFDFDPTSRRLPNQCTFQRVKPSRKCAMLPRSLQTMEPAWSHSKPSRSSGTRRIFRSGRRAHLFSLPRISTWRSACDTAHQRDSACMSRELRMRISIFP